MQIAPGQTRTLSGNRKSTLASYLIFHKRLSKLVYLFSLIIFLMRFLLSQFQRLHSPTVAHECVCRMGLKQLIPRFTLLFLDLTNLSDYEVLYSLMVIGEERLLSSHFMITMKTPQYYLFQYIKSQIMLLDINLSVSHVISSPYLFSISLSLNG